MSVRGLDLSGEVGASEFECFQELGRGAAFPVSVIDAQTQQTSRKVFAEQFSNSTAKTTGDLCFLCCDNESGSGRALQDQCVIEWFDGGHMHDFCLQARSSQ